MPYKEDPVLSRELQILDSQRQLCEHQFQTSLNIAIRKWKAGSPDYHVNIRTAEGFLKVASEKEDEMLNITRSQ